MFTTTEGSIINLFRRARHRSRPRDLSCCTRVPIRTGAPHHAGERERGRARFSLGMMTCQVAALLATTCRSVRAREPNTHRRKRDTWADGGWVAGSVGVCAGLRTHYQLLCPCATSRCTTSDQLYPCTTSRCTWWFKKE